MRPRCRGLTPCTAQAWAAALAAPDAPVRKAVVRSIHATDPRRRGGHVDLPQASEAVAAGISCVPAAGTCSSTNHGVSRAGPSAAVALWMNVENMRAGGYPRAALERAPPTYLHAGVGEAVDRSALLQAIDALDGPKSAVAKCEHPRAGRSSCAPVLPVGVVNLAMLFRESRAAAGKLKSYRTIQVACGSCSRRSLPLSCPPNSSSGSTP